MYSTRYRNRPRTRWLVALSVCGALLGVATSAQAADQALGTVIGAPSWELEAFRSVNAIYGNDVRVLHVAPEFNSSIVTVSVTRKDTGEPARNVYFPTYGNKPDGTRIDMSQMFRQINAFDSLSPAFIIGEGHTTIAQVEVLQSATGSFDPVRTRFLMLPGEDLGEIMATNVGGKIRVVHRQRAQIGAGDREVVLVAIEANGLLASDTATMDVPVPQVYGQSLARLVQSLNSNVSPQGASPSGQPTTLEVR